MSKYTTQVRFICENAAGLTESAGYNGVNQIIQKAIPKVFDFEFPIYDESYRNVLCTKILKHYYTREIGAETVGLWKLWLDTRLNEIMPYYNQLYKSALIEFNPMYDIDLTTTHNKTNDGKTDVTNSGSKNITGEHTNNTTKEGTIVDDRDRTHSTTANTSGESSGEEQSNNTDVSRDLYSDTPQGALDNVENQTYLTNARKVSKDGNNSGEYSENYVTNGTTNETVADDSTRTVNESIKDGGNITTNENAQETGKTVMSSTEEYLQIVQGKTGSASYSKLLQEYRGTFLNIDAMVIDDLKDLFLNLW